MNCRLCYSNAAGDCGDVRASYTENKGSRRGWLRVLMTAESTQVLSMPHQMCSPSMSPHRTHIRSGPVERGSFILSRKDFILFCHILIHNIFFSTLTPLLLPGNFLGLLQKLLHRSAIFFLVSDFGFVVQSAGPLEPN